MSWYGDYAFWAPRVPVATKIARGRAAAKKLAASEGRKPEPIAVQGRKIAKTFWGVKWCENLERYRDLSNRLPRGATYVRNGSVADLVIEPARVRAVVGGTEAYTVKIDIQTLKRGVWEAICRECAQAVDSLFDLLQGRFNDNVMQRLTQADGGLFPHKTEISMTCSCPDSASVCKHIAAAFYGVAARLDQRPDLLFKLRNVDHLELIAHATDAANLDQALSSSGESLSDADLGDIFGIELESTDISSAVPGKRTPKQ
nr:SWIM zinc finger family protein [Planctomycetaceae bacterium]